MIPPFFAVYYYNFAEKSGYDTREKTNLQKEVS
jgi:hypothetical protein